MCIQKSRKQPLVAVGSSVCSLPALGFSVCFVCLVVLRWRIIAKEPLIAFCNWGFRGVQRLFSSSYIRDPLSQTSSVSGGCYVQNLVGVARKSSLMSAATDKLNQAKLTQKMQMALDGSNR